MTDIDKLHDVFIHNFVVDRQCGKSYANCFDILGAVELGDKMIFCITNNERSLNNYMKMFLNIVEEERDYTIAHPTKDTFKILDSTICFITDYTYDIVSKGQCDHTIIEMVN